MAKPMNKTCVDWHQPPEEDLPLFQPDEETLLALYGGDEIRVSRMLAISEGREVGILSSEADDDKGQGPKRRAVAG